MTDLCSYHFVLLTQDGAVVLYVIERDNSAIYQFNASSAVIFHSTRNLFICCRLYISITTCFSCIFVYSLILGCEMTTAFLGHLFFDSVIYLFLCICLSLLGPSVGFVYFAPCSCVISVVSNSLVFLHESE